MKIYLLSRLLLLYAATLAIYVNSRSLNSELKGPAIQRPWSTGNDFDLTTSYKRIRREATLKAYRATSGPSWTEKKQWTRRVRAAFDAEECSSSQDLVSAGGTRPSDEELADFCAEHCDGLYSLGCTEDYVTCAGGIPYVMNCPESLALDIASEDCLERNQVEICKNASSKNALAFRGSAADFPSQNFSCKGLGNSFQSTGCSPTSIACIFNEAVLYAKCPGKLKFDLTTQSCQSANQVNECASEQSEITPAANEQEEETIQREGTSATELFSETPETGPSVEASPAEQPVAVGAPQPTPTPISYAQETSYSRMLAFSCEGKEDGLYGEECAVEIVACFDERAVLLRCPEGFLFDTSVRICKEQSTMSACGEGAVAAGAISTSPEVPASLQTVEESVPETTEATVAFGSEISENNETTVIPESSCEGLQDGIYGAGCSNQSFICIAGTPIALLVCPEMKLDMDTLSCLPEQEVSTCSVDSAREAEAPILMQAASTFAQPQKNEAAVEVSPNDIPEIATEQSPTQSKLMIFSCNDLPDGIYGEICATEFYVCIKGNAALLKCPDDFVYDAEKKYCVSRETIPQCQAETEQTFGAAAAGEETNETILEEPTDFSCEFLPDGMYGRGCSTQFTACVAGSPIPMECPAELKYDEESVKCLAAADIPACGGQEPDPVVSEDIEPVPVEGRPPVVQSSAAVELAPSCENKDDGLYGNGCSGEFYACVDGAPIVIRCPGLEKFDESTEQCLGAAYVPACGGESAAENVSAVAFGAASPSMLSVDPSSPEFSCDGLPDGTYVEGCSAEVTMCLSSKVVRFQCPSPLKYDAESMMCLPQDEVAACQQESLATNATEVSSGSVLLESQPPVPVQTSGFTCNGKPDGVYAQGCTADFVMCTSGLATYHHCPSPLKYDIEAEMCRQEELVSACSSQPGTETVSGGAPGDPSVINCTGQPDGPVSTGCSSIFQYCSNGELKQYVCPGGLKFDNVTQKCLAEQLVAACAENQQPVAFGSGTEGELEQSAGEIAAVIPIVYLIVLKDPTQPIGTPTQLKEIVSAVPVPEGANLTQLEDIVSALHLPEGTNLTQLQEIVSALPLPERTNLTQLKEIVSALPLLEGTNLTQLQEIVSALPLPEGTNLTQLEEAISAMPLPVGTNLTQLEEIVSAVPVPEETNLVEEIDTSGSVAVTAVGSCAGKPNGAYSEDCASEFYICIDGNIFYLHCRSPLKFDNETLQCAEAANIPACGVNADEATETVAFGAASPEFPCDGVPDGVYEEGQCSSAILVCIDNQNTTIHCPEEYAFKRDSLSCIAKEGLPECANQRTGEVAFGSSSGSGQEESELLCSEREDGIYAEGCNSDFFVCINKRAVQMRCPGLRKFDTASKQCLPLRYVKACGATNEVMRTLSSGSSAFEITAIQEGTHLLKPVGSVRFGTLPLAEPKPVMNLFPFAPFVTSCDGLPDGKYSRGCSSEFILCVGGRTKLNRCPSSLLKFDSASQRCLPASFVKGCGGEQAESREIESPVLPVNQAFGAFGTAVPSEDTSDVTCEGRPDGRYAQGCSPEIIQCENGEQQLLRCPGSLIFDGETGKCRVASYVKACTSQRIATLPAPSPAPVGTEIETTPSAGAKIIEKPLLTVASCFGMPDGTFADGCTPIFFMCIAGKETFYECPNNLKFDAVTEKCAPKSLVPACGGPVPEGPTFGREKFLGRTENKLYDGGAAPPMIGGNSTQRMPGKTTPIRTRQQRSSGCGKLPDGIYAQPCSSEFTLCVAGMPLVYRCPNEMIFDAQSEKCLIQDLVESCAGTTATVAGGVEAPAVETTEAPTEEVIEESTVEPAIFGASAGVSEPSIPVVYSITNISNLDSTRFFCLGKSDGIYIDGCTSDFFTCVKQTTLALHCTNSLKYDEFSGLCKDESEVAACTAGTGAVAFGASTSPAEISSSFQTRAANIPGTLQGFGSGVANTDLSAYCAGRLDGLYAEGCSSQFVSCLKGHGTSYDCPEDLKFDTVSSFCAPEDEIAACKGGPSVFQASSSPSSILETVGKALNINF